jgi:hypothetical protein
LFLLLALVKEHSSHVSVDFHFDVGNGAASAATVSSGASFFNRFRRGAQNAVANAGPGIQNQLAGFAERVRENVSNGGLASRFLKGRRDPEERPLGH